MRKSVIVTGAFALLGLAACGDELNVTNVQNPDVDRVLATSSGVLATVGGFGNQVFNPQRNSESVNTQSKIMAEESFATVANFGMAARVANRSLISNELGNDNATSNQANYFAFQRLSRSILNALAAFKRIQDAGTNTLSATQTNRVRAFAYFVLGQTYANISFAYDSGSIADETINTLDIPLLTGAAEVNAAALVAYDSAIAIATRGMDALPVTWINGNTPDQAGFIRLVRSYKARARAGIARTPAERAAVNWTEVLADATNGITADLVVQINGTTGWNVQFDANQSYVVGGWHTMPMRYIGMADSSGEYQNWVASSNKRQFLVRTRDARWPAGNTRAAQQAAGPTLNVAPAYLRNRPTGEDVIVASPGESMYNHSRYGLARTNTTIAGPFTEFSKTELDMLAAEAHLRAAVPNYAAAEVLINISRTRNGLPSVVGVGAGVVPGGNSCVPKLPNGTCGTLFEAMKYEKRMETAFTGYMQWYIDSRGWGDLMPSTVVEWPVPYQEMQARALPFYNGTRHNVGNTYGFTN